MVRPPLYPRINRYSGKDLTKRRKAIEHNAMAERVVDHLNRLIANDPAETQGYIWGFVAHDLKLTLDQVTSAVVDGGSNGITLEVRPEDRAGLRALQKLKRGMLG